MDGGASRQAVRLPEKGLSALELDADTPFSLCVTGSNTEALLEQDSAIPSLGDIPAIVEGVRWIIPQAGSVIEIGSQGARFITDLQSRAPQFAVNEHCAGGTGSFFEDQMSRVGCKLEDYSSLVEQAQSIPAFPVGVPSLPRPTSSTVNRKELLRRIFFWVCAMR